ncbi:MAG: AI-2E family transporter [Candidatus Saccharimonadales bacterium]
MFHFRRSNAPEKVEFTVTNRTVIRVVVMVILAFVLLAAIKRSAHTLTLIGVALFLALALNAPVHWLASHIPGRKRGSRSLATALSILIVIIALGGFLTAIVPPVVRQTNSFIKAAPTLISDLRSQDSSAGKFIRRYKLEGQVEKVSKQLSNRLNNASNTAVSTVTRIGSSVFATLTVLVLTVMMLTEGPKWLKMFKALLPDHQHDHAEKLARDMYQVVKGFVNGQVLLAAIAALLIVPMLFILHISYPIALMVVVFICGLIPMVGHTIGAIIVTTVALFHSIPTAIIILAYYILYQQIENYVVQPRIQANATNMSALLVFIAVILGVNFGGLLGGLVAIPVMGCMRIALIDYLENREILTKAERAEITNK